MDTGRIHGTARSTGRARVRAFATASTVRTRARMTSMSPPLAPVEFPFKGVVPSTTVADVLMQNPEAAG